MDTVSDVLFEREAELAQLARVVDAAAARTGSIAVVVGEPGCGKSSLVAAMATAARGRGVRVVVGRADPCGSPLDPLIEMLTPGANPLEWSRLVLVDRIVDVVESSVAEQPLLFVVEDLHFADDTTLAVLGALARRVRALGCGLAITARPAPRSPAAEYGRWLDELAGADGEHVRPGPLSDDAVARLVVRDCGAPPGPRLHGRLLGAAGNPLLVHEFMRAATTVGALVINGDQVELDEAAADLRIDLPAGIAARLGVLSDAANEVLHVAAVLGPCPIDWLGSLLECAAASVRKAVCEATAAGFLDPASTMVQFRHELLREAFAVHVSPASQAAIHRHVGRHIAAAGAPSGLVARHLELGSPIPDAETIHWMRRAAADAAVLDPRTAADLLGRVVAAMPIDAPDRGQVLAERARALVWLGRPTEARTCAADALAQPAAATTRAALREVLAEASLLEGRPGDAVAEIDRALETCADDPLLRARLRAQAATTRLWAFDLPGAAADAEAATELGTMVGDPVAASRALSVSSHVAAFQLDLRRAVRAGELAVGRAADVPAAVRSAPHLYLGLALVNADQFDRARRVLDEGCARCEKLGAAWALPRYQGALCILSFFTGAWDDAVAASETGRLIAQDTGCRAGQAQIDATIGLIAHHRGEESAATAAVHRVVAATAEPGADGAALPYLCWLQALRAESRGELAEGVDRLQRACSLAFQLGVPLVALWLAPDLSRLALADGQTEVAEWIATEIERVAPGAATVTADAVARFCRGIVEQDVDGLLAAADGFETAGRPFFAARALDAAGGAARVAGRVAAGVDALRRAAGLYDRLGAVVDGRATRRELRALGVRTGARGPRRRPVIGWCSLTPAEHTVASLVADGLANGEIASRLFVSKRTVETHISRLYSKLQVDNRVAIANIGREPTEPVPA